MGRLSQSVSWAAHQGIIQKSETEQYEFALSYFGFWLLSWGTFLLPAIFLGLSIPALIYICAFEAVRLFAGGFHQSSRVKCYLTSCGIYLLVLAGAFLPDTPMLVIFAFSLLCPVMVVYYAPLSHENKPLVAAEKKLYRKRAIQLSFITALAVVAAYCIGLSTTAYFIAASQLTVLALMMAQVIHNRLHSKPN